LRHDSPSASFLSTRCHKYDDARFSLPEASGFVATLASTRQGRNGRCRKTILSQSRKARKERPCQGGVGCLPVSWKTTLLRNAPAPAKGPPQSKLSAGPPAAARPASTPMQATASRSQQPVSHAQTRHGTADHDGRPSLPQAMTARAKHGAGAFPAPGRSTLLPGAGKAPLAGHHHPVRASSLFTRGQLTGCFLAILAA
jgi:hypothetical protein